jgi:hypothetical protein
MGEPPLPELRDRPPAMPVIVDRHTNVPDVIIAGTEAHTAYAWLKGHPDEARTVPELNRELDLALGTTSLNNYVKRGYLFKTAFQVPSLGKFGPHLSLSQRGLSGRGYGG